jgi:GT2 family glycosyltransferase
VIIFFKNVMAITKNNSPKEHLKSRYERVKTDSNPNYPSIWAIIVTWNGSKWISKAIESVLSSSIPLSLLVVDNASTDDSKEIISRFPNVNLIKNQENLGFGKANNLGIKYALTHGAEYILLLNQDVKIDEFMVENLLNVYCKYREYGLLSPLQLDYEGEGINSRIVGNLKSNNQLLSDAILGNLQEIYDLPFIPAAIWLIPTQILEKIGGFDPIFFMYGEDTDYCHRVRFHGFKIGLVPNARAFHWHYTHQSLKESSSRSYTPYIFPEITVELKNPNRHILLNYLFVFKEWSKRILYLLINLEIRLSLFTIASLLYAIYKVKIIWKHWYISRSKKRPWLNN